MRIGYGFDSHEFRPGIPLKIGGIALAHDKGLGGHSDGDVLLHAITDALLGAIAAPDIGALFPPSDPKWKGADSVIFLREALKRVREAGYSIANIDSSLILAAPKIGPHATVIRTRVAELIGALRMPLHSHHEMIRRRSFQSFDDAVVGTAGYNAQAFADRLRGLMMRGVHRHDQRKSDLRPFDKLRAGFRTSNLGIWTSDLGA